MTVKRGYTTVQALAGEYITEHDLRGKIDEDLLYRWAHTRAEELIGTEQLDFAVALLQVENFEAKSPAGLHSIYLAACAEDASRTWNREMFVGYKEKVYGTDCDIEVTLKCPECDQTACACSTPVMDIRVDELYLKQHPQYWAQTMHGYLGYAATTNDGFPCTNFSPDYKIMKPRPAEDAFWNSEYFLGVCSAIPGHLPYYSFEVSGDRFLTDLKEGQVYLAYLRYLKDKDGYLLIPDYPVVIRAIVAYITEKVMWTKWMKGTGNQNDRLRWLDAKNESLALLAEARNEIEIPGPDKWMQMVKKHWILPTTRYYQRNG